MTRNLLVPHGSDTSFHTTSWGDAYRSFYSFLSCFLAVLLSFVSYFVIAADLRQVFLAGCGRTSATVDRNEPTPDDMEHYLGRRGSQREQRSRGGAESARKQEQPKRVAQSRKGREVQKQ